MDFFLITAEAPGVQLVVREDLSDATCPRCGQPLERSPDAVYRVEVIDPEALADLMHPPPIYLAGPRFADWYAQSGFAGLAVEPLPDARPLHRLRPASTARLDPASGIEVVEECPECGFRDVEIVGVWTLDEKSWDGSDFFTVEERPESIFCTSKARHALESSGLRGPVFIERELISI